MNQLLSLRFISFQISKEEKRRIKKMQKGYKKGVIDIANKTILVIKNQV